MRDLRSELNQIPDEWPPAWRPQPGETLVGTVLRYAQGHTAYGKVHTVLLVDDNGEEHSIWLFNTVLLDLFREHRPRPGEKIGVKYLGKDPDKGYHKHRLVVDRPDPADPLAPLGGEADLAAVQWRN